MRYIRNWPHSHRRHATIWKTKEMILDQWHSSSPLPRPQDQNHTIANYAKTFPHTTWPDDSDNMTKSIINNCDEHWTTVIQQELTLIDKQCDFSTLSKTKPCRREQNTTWCFYFRVLISWFLPTLTRTSPHFKPCLLDRSPRRPPLPSSWRDRTNGRSDPSCAVSR